MHTTAIYRKPARAKFERWDRIFVLVHALDNVIRPFNECWMVSFCLYRYSKRNREHCWPSPSSIRLAQKVIFKHRVSCNDPCVLLCKMCPLKEVNYDKEVPVAWVKSWRKLHSTATWSPNVLLAGSPLGRGELAIRQSVLQFCFATSRCKIMPSHFTSVNIHLYHY